MAQHSTTHSSSSGSEYYIRNTPGIVKRAEHPFSSLTQYTSEGSRLYGSAYDEELMYPDYILSGAGTNTARARAQMQYRSKCQQMCMRYKVTKACSHTAAACLPPSIAQAFTTDDNGELLIDFAVYESVAEGGQQQPSPTEHKLLPVSQKCTRCRHLIRSITSPHFCNSDHYHQLFVYNILEWRIDTGITDRTGQYIEVPSFATFMSPEDYRRYITYQMVDVEDEISRLGLKTTAEEIMLQDPIYTRTRNLILSAPPTADFIIDERVAAVFPQLMYFNCIYIKHRLIPFLRSKTREAIEEVVLPVYHVSPTSVSASNELITATADESVLLPSTIEIVHTAITDSDTRHYVRNLVRDSVYSEDQRVHGAAILATAGRVIHMTQEVRFAITRHYDITQACEIHTHVRTHKDGYMRLPDCICSEKWLPFVNLFGVIPSTYRYRIRHDELRQPQLYLRAKTARPFVWNPVLPGAVT